MGQSWAIRVGCRQKGIGGLGSQLRSRKGWSQRRGELAGWQVAEVRGWMGGKGVIKC
jgi:hypothetical protein